MKLFLTTIVTVFLLAACVTEDVPRNEGVSVGDPLPQFEVTLNTGNIVTTASLHGKVAMIIFFSTTCEDCRRELPGLEGIYRYFENSEVVEIFAISREEKPGAVETFWVDAGLTIPYSSQSDRAVYNLFATVGVPRIYITDKDNMIVAAFGEDDFPGNERIIEIIEKETI